MEQQIKNFKENIIPELSFTELKERCIELYAQNLQFRFMITEGLGWSDMINDISPMHEI